MKIDCMQYIQASMLGGFRGLVGLPFEHPFDTVKTRLQSNPNSRSSWEIAFSIWKSKGVPGFYSGAIPNAFRVTFKQTYRWPMMLAFPGFFRSILPQSAQKGCPTLHKTCAGLSIATCETFLITPFERLKVYLMTAGYQNRGIRTFFIQNQSHILGEMFRGLNVVYARQMASWVSFLVADEKFKTWERNRTGNQTLEFTSLIRVSFFVGSANTLANMPFDVAKTLAQKANYVESAKVFPAIQMIYKQYGWRGLYAGWQVRMLQYMIQSVFTVSLLEKLEQSWRYTERE